MIKVGIVGASGWTGCELLRLLLQHPQVDIVAITSRSLEGKAISELFPNLLGQSLLVFSQPKVEVLSQCDLVFFATPHGVAMQQAPKLLNQGIKVIDLGADFRLKDITTWQNYYQIKHSAKAWVEKAVYGLCEVNRNKIKTAQLIANPGCYPTAVSLGLKPLLEANCINTSTIIADCKSGVSGAGRVANMAMGLCEASESFKAYGVSGHRHLPEIKQSLSDVANTAVDLIFVPHLLPMIRGILATIYVDLTQDLSNEAVFDLFTQAYKNEQFVQVLPIGSTPETRAVKGSNQCHIGFYVLSPQKLVVICALDNLQKGASAQAVQNMNILFDIPEQTGLSQIATIP